MAELRKGLTWSKKWHIVDASRSDNELYDVALCGAYLYNPTKERHRYRGASLPTHLQAIIDGTAKSTGDCKLCSKAVGIKTATVKLPDQNGSAPFQQSVTPTWPVPLINPRTGEVHTDRLDNGEVWLYDSGRIATIGVPSVLNTAADARSLAAALLAAAEEKEKRDGHQAQG